MGRELFLPIKRRYRVFCKVWSWNEVVGSVAGNGEKGWHVVNRIMVIGVSSGGGKSTFARKLGQILKIRVYHLDAFYWKPGWVESSPEEFVTAQQEIVNQRQWIMEGNYSRTFEMRAEHADTMIYLELPRYLCLLRVIKRILVNMGKTRPDMGEGCPDHLRFPPEKNDGAIRKLSKVRL